MATRDELIAVSKQITVAADTSTGRGTLEDDVEAATGSVASTIENFKVVQAKLVAIDNLNLTPTKYAPKWAPMYEEYMSIITNSKDFASKIAAYGTQFDQAVLKVVTDHSYSPEIQMVVVNASIDKTTEFSDISQSIQSRIDVLSRDLLIFKEEIRYFAEAQEGQLKAEMQAILIEIAKIKHDIMVIDGNINSTANELKAAEIGVGVAGGFFPLFGLYLLIAGTNGVLAEIKGRLERLQNQMAGKRQQLREEEARKAVIEHTLAQITAARIVVNDVSDRIDNIRGTLKFFDSVWSGIKGQCVEILEFLSAARDTPVIMEVYLMLAKTSYESLADALRLYVRGLTLFKSAA